MLDAASDRADELIAEDAATAVSNEYFDTLLEALEQPAKKNKALARRAQRARRVTQL